MPIDGASNRNRAAGDLAMGAIAGAVGALVLQRVSGVVWKRERRRVRAREQRARPLGLDPAHLIAYRAARLAGRRVRPRQPTRAGTAIHYGLGLIPGAIYAAVLRKRWPAVGKAGGLLFGTAVFLLHDELTNWLLRLSGPPRAYPWQAHARGLAAHAAFGATTEFALRVMERARAEWAQLPSGEPRAAGAY